MDKYEEIGIIGEGSYGTVVKCQHRETGQFVAIKKFNDSQEDKFVQEIAAREVKMLKKLHHDNLINLIDIFQHKQRSYLVFEFVDHSLMEDLKCNTNGLEEKYIRRIIFQVLKGIEFCHLHNVIHRDIKPENILVSKTGVVKICDFGFARMLAKSCEPYTDYVATRWYRAPELLVGDLNYGRAIDIWAIGCLMAELLSGHPLFPGDSDIDQLYRIIQCFGNLSTHQQDMFYQNPNFSQQHLPVIHEVVPLDERLCHSSSAAVDLVKQCLQLDSDERPPCSQLLQHEFFTKDGFIQKFGKKFLQLLQQEHRDNLPQIRCANGRGDEVDHFWLQETDEQLNRNAEKLLKERHGYRCGIKTNADEKNKIKLPDADIAKGQQKVKCSSRLTCRSVTPSSPASLLPPCNSPCEFLPQNGCVTPGLDIVINSLADCSNSTKGSVVKKKRRKSHKLLYDKRGQYSDAIDDKVSNAEVQVTGSISKCDVVSLTETKETWPHLPDLNKNMDNQLLSEQMLLQCRQKNGEDGQSLSMPQIVNNSSNTFQQVSRSNDRQNSSIVRLPFV